MPDPCSTSEVETQAGSVLGVRIALRSDQTAAESWKTIVEASLLMPVPPAVL